MHVDDIVVLIITTYSYILVLYKLTISMSDVLRH